VTTPPRRAVFLDRDGVVVEDVGYLRSPDQLRLLPGAAEAIRRLREAGYLAIVVTNQSGVARGYFGEEDVRRAHAALEEMLRAAGTKLDAIYYCPHHPTEGEPPYRVACSCRKPEPGMLLQAAADLGIDLKASALIGDKPSDVEAAHRAGCRAALVVHVAERGSARLERVDVEYVTGSLSEAANAILGAPGC
jgi:D-glycero-D-manno-heptose 1,7-bisphosphate phosphatase